MNQWQGGEVAKWRVSRTLLFVLCLSHFATWSLGHSTTEASISKSDKHILTVGDVDQFGGSSTSTTHQQRSSSAGTFSTGTLSSVQFQVFSGILGAALGPKQTTPIGKLDLTTLYAKTSPSGTQISAGTWQRDADPIFIWEPQSPELVQGYSYALDAQPDAAIDTTGTSWDVSQDLMKTLADGKRVFTVHAVGSGSNTGTPKSFEVWIDRTPPAIGSYSPVAGALLGTLAPTISVNVSDAGSGFGAQQIQLLINGSPASILVDETTGVVTASGSGGVKEGANAVTVEASDRVGNQQTPLVWSFTADATPPSGTLLINAGASRTTSVYVTLNLSATDAISGVTGMLLSNDANTGFVQEPFNPARELWKLNAVTGPQKVYVKFIDKAGNISPPQVAEIDLHLLAPETLLLSGPAGFTPSQEAQFTFTCPEGGCLFSYAFDHDDWSPWSAETTAVKGGLVYGNHYFRVKAAKESNGVDGIQAEEEEDPTPAERAWIVGVQPPGIVVPYGPPVKLWKVE